ncbi:efflux RND transporter permease subunit [Blautia sp.]|uniref:efflux RND transporter permease subunit n=1 Tax=Blautia sp. TaxID=1955243 RepID=UPI0026200F44|nr:efflux RND transporter permease subunit [Blautia sp.]
MLSRYSVKKPYTVVVAVVLVLILGVVSFTKMNTDLLPSMDMPYAMVMTTYPGASPETVEQTVTRPIEQSMATVSNITNVSSVSSENASVVILEFSEDANMDSVTLEMRENLDQIKGYWDESVGNPMIMKLNPDMLPVLVAAVDMDGLTAPQTTDYVENHILQEMESIAGVARVSVSGGVTEQIRVELQQDKIDGVNQKVQDAINGKFAGEEQKLQDAQKQLEEGQAQLESGRQQLESGQQAAAGQIGQGSAQLSQAKEQMQTGLQEISAQLQTLEEKQAELEKQGEVLTASRAPIEAMLKELTAAKNEYYQAAAGKQKLENTIVQLETQIATATESIAQLESQLEQAQTPEEQQELQNAIGEMNAQLDSLNMAKTEAQAQLQTLNEGLALMDIEVINKGIEEANSGLSQIAQAQAQLDAGLAQITQGKEKLNQAREQLESGKSQMSAAEVQLETQKILAAVQMSSAAAKIEVSTSQMQAAQSQIDAGKEQLDAAKEQIQEQTDLHTILTQDMIKGILAAENFAMPAGYVQEDKKDYLVRVGEKVQDVDTLKDLVILDLGLEGLDPIKLSDVAEIQVTDDSSEVYAVINGNPGVMLTIEKQTGYSTGEVTDKILDRMESLEQEEKGLHFTTLMDQGIYIDMVIQSVMQNMIYGGILAVLILFVFLRSVRPTFVIACSIPISVVAALVMMYFSGVTLNIISLSSLALGVGMLVDNSIVVIENIYRMRNEGVPARKAAIEGAKQVAGAITSSTLTTVCVFAPIVFTEGITRQLFVEMGLTIAYSLAASLFVALTVVPMMSAGLLQKTEEKQSRFLDKLQEGYSQLILKALHHKTWVLLGALGLFLLSSVLSISKGTEFFPSMESTQVTMTITTEKGTPLEETAAKSNEVMEKISDIKDIESIGAMASGSSMMSGESNTNTVTMYLVLKEEKTLNNAQLEKEIKKRTKDVKDCEIQISTDSMDMSALGGSGINIQISGKELDELQSIAKDLAKKLEGIKGTQNVSDGLEDADAEYEVMVNKEKAMEYNLTVAQVFQAINKELAEAASATTISTAAKDYEVYVESDAKEAMTRESIGKIPVEYTDSEGKKGEVLVGELAEFKDSFTPQSITREDQSRYVSVSAEIATGYNIGLVSQKVQKMLDDYHMPEGYRGQMTGEDETINEAMGQLMLMLVLALVFMYLIMVAQFQSLLSPFIIMFTIPLAFTGGFLGLLLTGKPVSIIAMIGFVMLSGIIVNNGIVLVDYINQMRKEGMEKYAAIAKAGKDRLRPIIMTALTTVLGLVTMAMGLGMGGDMVQPMAIVTIGGLLYGTLLTLFVVPCIYDILNHKSYQKDEKRLEDKE